MKNRLLLYLLMSLLYVEVESQFHPTKGIFIDLAPYTFVSGEVVTEKVIDPPFAFNHKNRSTPTLEVTMQKSWEILSLGFGVSTHSVRQNFSIDYPLPRQDSYQSTSYDFFRHMAGVHVYAGLRQLDFQIGLRLGVYSTILQNKCNEDVDHLMVHINSELGTKKAHIIEKCQTVETTLAKALTQVDMLYRIHNNLWGGINVVLFQWRNNYRRSFLKFKLYEDLEWTDGTAPPPLINDIEVFEPKIQVGINLRYEFNFSKKSIPTIQAN
jgi:hypothetical protein